MIYGRCISSLPPDLTVGSEVGVVGDGNEVYTVIDIERSENGSNTVYLSSGWIEPLSKIYMLRGRPHSVAADDPTSWIKTAIGECDECGVTFPDSCAYYQNDGKHICLNCHGTKQDLHPWLATLKIK